MHQPYKIDYNDKFNGIFTTDFNIIYAIEFYDYSMMFPKNFKNENIYTFNFFVLNGNEYKTQPKDERVKLTIFSCLIDFFQNIENVVITICDSLDKKEFSRHKLFDKWFSEMKNTNIEKYDCISEGDGLRIYNSLLLHKDNSHKKKIIQLYFDLNDNEMMPL